MAGKNKTQTRISKEDYKRIRAKIKVKLRAYKINPDKAENYLERFKGLDITSIGEERIESLIRGEVEKSKDPSVLFELGVISEENFDWKRKGAILDAMITLTEELKKKGKEIEEITSHDLLSTGLRKLIDFSDMYGLLKLVKPDLKPWQLTQVSPGYWDDPKNVKEAVEWLVDEMAKEGKKLVEITQDDFRDLGLGSLAYYHNLYDLLKLVKPDLKPWDLIQVPHGYWDDPEHVKEAVKWLVEEMAKEGKRLEEIIQDDFIDAGLATLIQTNKVYDLLKLVKPDLKPWQLSQVTAGYWDDPEHVKEAVKWLVEEMAKEGKKIEEITQDDFLDAGLGSLLIIHKLNELLRLVRPNLKDWNLNRVSSGFWDDPKNVKEAVELLVEEMKKKGKKLEEISAQDFKDLELNTLISKYSLYDLLKLVKPDLKPWELKKVSNRFWDDPKNRKEAVELLVEEMKKKGKRLEEISAQDFKDLKLNTLISKYSLYDLLKLVKPDLKPWELRQITAGYWDDPEHVREAVEWLVEKMKKEGKKIEEIRKKDFVEAGLSTLVRRYRKAELLKLLDPDNEE